MAKVLVADDDPDFVQVMRTILKSEGYEVAAATDGDEALSIMREDRIDLILLDVMMASVLDGVSVAHEMREDPELKDIPVIMVSSIIDSPHASMFPTGEDVPMSAWFTKPVPPAGLLRKVARFIE